MSPLLNSEKKQIEKIYDAWKISLPPVDHQTCQVCGYVHNPYALSMDEADEVRDNAMEEFREAQNQNAGPEEIRLLREHKRAMIDAWSEARAMDDAWQTCLAFRTEKEAVKTAAREEKMRLLHNPWGERS